MIHRFVPKADQIYVVGSLVRVNGTWCKVLEIIDVFCGRHGEVSITVQCIPIADERVPLKDISV